MAEFIPPCLLVTNQCEWSLENRYESGEQCQAMLAKLLSVDAVTVLEASGGCPQSATRKLMHAAVDGDPQATAQELKLGYDYRPVTTAFRRRGDI